ncbi:MAG: hypothetical protein F6K11_20470 [Leptolyngbya sp. SIO3F4]|nr:hypothetical protein [Leptolyngbya sp. SIO3F4]
MPLPNNPYPNKIDLVYAISVELANNVRKQFNPLINPLKLSKPKLKEIIQSTQVETVSKDKQQLPL